MRDSHLPQMLFAALGLFILGGCHWDFHAATLLSSQNGDTLSGFEFKYEFSEKSPDGTRYLTYFSGGGTMTLLDVDTHQSVRELEMYYECEGPCLHLAWSPDS